MTTRRFLSAMPNGLVAPRWVGRKMVIQWHRLCHLDQSSPHYCVKMLVATHGRPLSTGRSHRVNAIPSLHGRRGTKLQVKDGCDVPIRLHVDNCVRRTSLQLGPLVARSPSQTFRTGGLAVLQVPQGPCAIRSSRSASLRRSASSSLDLTMPSNSDS